MKAIYVQDGNSIDYVPAADTEAGSVVIVNSLVGITKWDIPANTLGALALSGVFDIEKAATASFAAGAVVYWDSTNKNATATADGNTAVGIAVSDAAVADAAVRVRIN